MKLNNGLNLDGNPETTETGDYRYAKNVTLDNTYRFPINEDGMSNLDIDVSGICGIIPFDKGFVVFHYDGNSKITVIKTNHKDLPNERIYRQLTLQSSLKFVKENPIRGSYTYNQNGHLVIVFSSGVNGNFEDKIIDIDSYGTDVNYTLSEKDMYYLNINPNIVFPYITNESTSGSLNTGSYQIAVCYKLDKDYSNYSLLSIPYYVYGHLENGDGKIDGLKPNTTSTEGIKFMFSNLDTNYKFYKLAILYNDGVSYSVFNTPDISTNIDNYSIKDTNTFTVGSLSDTLIKSIFYSNSETMSIMGNRLYRANLKTNNLKIGNTYFDDIAQQLASNVTLELKSSMITPTRDIKGKQYIKFQNDEVYALYLTLGDKKGNIIGSYPINSPNILGTGLTNSAVYDTEYLSKTEITIPNPHTTTINKYKNEILSKTLNYISNTITLTPSFRKVVTSKTIEFKIDFNSAFVYMSGNNSLFEQDISINYQFSWYDIYGQEYISHGQCIYRANNDNIQQLDINEFDSAVYANDTGLLEIVNNISIDVTNSNKSENVCITLLPVYAIVYKVLAPNNVTENYTFYTTVLYNLNSSLYTELEGYLTIPANSNYIEIQFDSGYDINIYTSNIEYLKNYSLTIQFTYTINPDIVIPELYLYDNIGLVNIENITTTVNDKTLVFNFVTKSIITEYSLHNFSNVDFITFTLSIESSISKSNICRMYYKKSNTELENHSTMQMITMPANTTTITSDKVYGYYDYFVNYSIYDVVPNSSFDFVKYKYKIDNVAINRVHIVTTITENSSDRQLHCYIEIGFSEAETSIIEKSNTATIAFTPASIQVFVSNSTKYYYDVCKESLLKSNDENNTEYTSNYIEVTLPDNLNTILGDFKDTIGFWCIHRAERSNTNSKINCQGILKNLQYQFVYNSKFYNRYPTVTTASDAGYFTQIIYSGTTPFIFRDNGKGGILMEAYMVTGAADYMILVPIYEVNGKWTDGWLTFDKHPLNVGVHIVNVQTSVILCSSNISNYDANSWLSFYSFEDLFNKNDNFPISEIHNISYYDFNFLASNNIANFASKETFYNIEGLTKEYNYEDHSKILEQLLIQGNNLAVSNAYNMACRRLIVPPEDSYTTGMNILRKNTVSDSEKIYRANIYNNVTEFYANIYNEVLVLCSSMNRLSDNKISCYGDTFYSCFNVHLKQTHMPTDGINIGDINNDSVINPLIKHFYFSVFIESKYNIHARYWEGDYPAWEQPINTDKQTGYNKVYHLENKEDVTTIVDLGNNDSRKKDGNYPTRIIMSVKGNSEANLLNFRRYLAADYYDMPYTRNAIVSIMATYKNLYIQQELGCFIASIKDVISYQDGATYVGSGQLFDRIPTELIPTPYGFVGCENYFNCGITDKGLWIIDNVQGLIFWITDNDIQIISEGKNKKWFKENLSGNNPFNNDGCFITYDNNNNVKRFILTISNKDISISYIPEIKNWLSFHDYHPNFGFYTRNNTYYVSNNTKPFSKFDNLLKAKHSLSNTIFKSIISLYWNEDSKNDKLFTTAYWDSAFDVNDVGIYDKTFTQLFMHNDSQCTPLLDIKDNAEWSDVTNGTFKANHWIFNNIFDYVINNKKPFLSDFMTFITSNLDTQNNSREWFELSKFISTFVCITFIFDNYYYSVDGSIKSATKTDICLYQPNISLLDVYIDSIKNNR